MKTRECDLWADIAAMIKNEPKYLEDLYDGLCSLLSDMYYFDQIGVTLKRKAALRIKRALHKTGRLSGDYLHQNYEWRDGVRLRWVREFMRESE